MNAADLIAKRRAARLFDVPLHTPTKRCRCGVTLHMIATPAGNRLPVRCDVPGGAEPTADAPGRGAAHFADCPYADVYRRPRSPHRHGAR